MVLTVTLNPVLDRVVEIRNFRAGEVNRVERERARIAGGKGINVSRILKLFHVPNLAVGWLGGEIGKEVEKRLDEEGIAHDFVWIERESRQNLTIVDPEKGKETHLVEKGPDISLQEREKLKKKIRYLAEKSKIVVFSGSVPRGVEKEVYFELIILVKEVNPQILSVLDTSGILLKNGIRAIPGLVKPNIEELAGLSEKGFSSVEDIAEEAGQLRKKGIHMVVVSQGAGEVVAATEDGTFILTPPAVDPLNTVGAGDAMVGGMVAALYQGKKTGEVLTLGVATGTASVESGRERPLKIERIFDLSRRIKIRKLS